MREKKKSTIESKETISTKQGLTASNKFHSTIKRQAVYIHITEFLIKKRVNSILMEFTKGSSDEIVNKVD